MAFSEKQSLNLIILGVILIILGLILAPIFELLAFRNIFGDNSFFI